MLRPASPPPSGLKGQAKDLLKQFSFSKKTAEMAGPSGGVAEPDRVARRKFQQFMFTQEETEFKPPTKAKAKQGRELTVHITLKNGLQYGSAKHCTANVQIVKFYVSYFQVNS